MNCFIGYFCHTSSIEMCWCVDVSGPIRPTEVIVATDVSRSEQVEHKHQHGMIFKQFSGC